LFSKIEKKSGLLPHRFGWVLFDLSWCDFITLFCGKKEAGYSGFFRVHLIYLEIDG